MLANVGTMSHGLQAVILFIAFVFFVVSTVLHWTAKAYAIAFIAAGLAAWVFVLFWLELARA